MCVTVCVFTWGGAGTGKMAANWALLLPSVKRQRQHWVQAAVADAATCQLRQLPVEAVASCQLHFLLDYAAWRIAATRKLFVCKLTSDSAAPTMSLLLSLVSYLLSPPSLSTPLSLLVPLSYTHLSPACSLASSSLLCVFRCLAFASLAAIHLLHLACTNTQMPAPSSPPLLHPPLPACHIPAIPAPILIAIANRCQNASMQSAALRSCCLPCHSPLFLQYLPPSLVFLFLYTCCSCCSLCSLFLLLLLPSCSCCSLTNCVASSLSRQAPRRTCCHLAAMRQLLLSLPLRWLWQVESRLGWSNCESYQDDQGVNKFIQSFIETNWLTDDDDDDGDDDDDAQEWGKWVSDRDRQTGRTCHSGSGSNNKAQHACQSGYLSRSSAHPFNFCLHFKSCVWAAMSDELPLYTPAPPPSPAALPPPHDCCPTLVACQLCCNSVYFVIRQRRRIFGMQMPEMETEMETETEKETDTGHPILGQCITITGHK